MSRSASSPSVLSLNQARALHLAAQGLLRKPRARASRAGLVAAIERMQLLQIDTIHVVARSPYLVLHSRLGAYPAAWLDEALAAGKLFECWAHEACFASMRDYSLHRDFVGSRTHWAMRNAQRYAASHAEELAQLLQRIARDGPVKTSDFDRPVGAAAGGGWWGWKQEKRWLEALFALGELMISRRDNFHRVYDLRERVLQKAKWENEPSRGDAQGVRREFILRAIRALGISQARWVADYFRLGRQIRDAELTPLLDSGEILRVAVRGWDAPAYVHRDHAELHARALAGGLRASRNTLLSPFDPVVWDRERALALFDFDYRLECYTPEPKRKFGYFVLPILLRGRLAGRLDAKAHRGERRFEIKALHLEEGVDPDARLIDDLAEAVVECAAWHQTPTVVVAAGVEKSLRRALQSAIVARTSAASTSGASSP